MKSLFLSLSFALVTNALFAAIVYHDNNDAVYPWSNSSWTFDINQDGNDDVSLITNAGNPNSIRFTGLTNVYGANRVQSVPGTAHAVDCTNDTLDAFTTVWDNQSYIYKPADPFNIGYGNHKQGVRLIKDMTMGGSGYLFSYIDYSFTVSGDVIIHGWYYEDSFNVPIVANTLLDYPYDANCIHYDTVAVYDTLTIYDTTFISVTDTLFIDVNDAGQSNLYLTTIKVFPNPTSDQVIIDNGDYGQMVNYEIKITNSQAQIVFDEIVDQQNFTISISSLGGSGTYYLTLYDDTGAPLTTRKIILI